MCSEMQCQATLKSNVKEKQKNELKKWIKKWKLLKQFQPHVKDQVYFVFSYQIKCFLKMLLTYVYNIWPLLMFDLLHLTLCPRPQQYFTD